MGLKLKNTTIKKFRRTLAFFVLSIFLIWPIFHIALVNNLTVSPWRLFGWGMYAVPDPESQSRLRVVIPDKTRRHFMDVVQLHSSLAKFSTDPSQESLCINLFAVDSFNTVRKLPGNGLCRSEILSHDLDYFLHFGSLSHLSDFVNEALLRAHRAGSEAYAFLTHQRLNLFQGKAYLESEVYRVLGKETQYLGKIINNGEANEEPSF